jgi:positive regulator of sigma E activity
MKDKGVVISADKDFARVQVDCLSGCKDCSAHTLCIGEKNMSGLLSVRNPVGAGQGDKVSISVPESQYSRALIVTFGSLLLAILAGGGAGYALGPHFPLDSAVSGALGLLFALVFTSLWLSRYFKKVNRSALYPIITEIIQKGVL